MVITAESLEMFERFADSFCLNSNFIFTWSSLETSFWIKTSNMASLTCIFSVFHHWNDGIIIKLKLFPCRVENVLLTYNFNTKHKAHLFKLAFTEKLLHFNFTYHIYLKCVLLFLMFLFHFVKLTVLHLLLWNVLYK